MSDQSDDLYFDESDFQENPPEDVVAYTELRSCADLFRMYQSDDLDISPDFQREEVWKTPAKTRFIDSLIKQLPIPSLCFAYDYNSEEWQVIDGLQRISSIIKFLDKNSDWVLSKLDDIDPRISGKSVSEFHQKGTPFYKLKSRVENTTIPITVLRCDPSKENHANYLFMIFHRLNSGGMKLNNQEIRNCIFSGKLNELLKTLNKYDHWIELIEKTGNSISNERFRRIELILRFFAFYDSYKSYEGELAKFLNNYMRKYKKPTQKFITEKTNIFEITTKSIASAIDFNSIKLGTAAIEALLIGVSLNIKSFTKLSTDEKRNRIASFTQLPSISPTSLSEGIAKKSKLIQRLEEAINHFK